MSASPYSGTSQTATEVLVPCSTSTVSSSSTINQLSSFVNVNIGVDRRATHFAVVHGPSNIIDSDTDPATMVPIPKRGDQYLFNPELLGRLDFTRSSASFKPLISAANPGEPWMVVRPLKESDYDRGFLKLLGQLTSVGAISRAEFLSRFAQMKVSGDYYVTVIEDTRSNEIIGSATLVVEHKFIHECGSRGRLEDVVVNDTYRGKQLGKLIVVAVTLLAQTLGCYKMTLECKDKLIKFYNSLGYILEPGNGNSMQIRYESAPVANLTAAIGSIAVDPS